MNIIISETSNNPIYEQIIRQMKEQILNQKILGEEPLPSIRGLAKDLQISVITTKRAYEELESEGLIYSIPGKGFFVASKKLEILKEKKLQVLEGKILDLIDESKAAGISKEELADMVELLWSDGSGS